MTALVAAIALVIGVVFSEVLLRYSGNDAWPVRRLAAIRNELQLFRAADNDDARQRHLIRCGMATLTVSVAVLVAIAVCGAIFSAPMFLLPWSDDQAALYLGLSAVSAIGWWMLRHSRDRH